MLTANYAALAEALTLGLVQKARARGGVAVQDCGAREIDAALATEKKFHKILDVRPCGTGRVVVWPDEHGRNEQQLSADLG
jgi:hypothetical protein